MAENSLAKFEGYFKMSLIIVDCKLFTRITGNTQHLLYPLLPLNASITTLYIQSLRHCSHSHTSVLRYKNFITRMLYCDALY